MAERGGASSRSHLRHDLKFRKIKREIKYHLDRLCCIEILIIAICVHLQLMAIHHDLLTAVLESRVHVSIGRGSHVIPKKTLSSVLGIRGTCNRRTLRP